MTDEEKEAARKDKEKALKDLHERARMAKEDNAKTAHDFEKAAEDSPTEEIFQSEVEAQIFIDEEEDRK